jgi:hypothetical protein
METTMSKASKSLKKLTLVYKKLLGMTFGSKNVHWTSNRVPKQLQPKDTRTIRIGMFNDWDG